MYVIQYLTALNVMIKNDFSGSKELKDQLIHHQFCNYDNQEVE